MPTRDNSYDGSVGSGRSFYNREGGLEWICGEPDCRVCVDGSEPANASVTPEIAPGLRAWGGFIPDIMQVVEDAVEPSMSPGTRAFDVTSQGRDAYEEILNRRAFQKRISRWGEKGPSRLVKLKAAETNR